METLICSNCGLKKDVSEFYKRKDTKTGYRKECKQCRLLKDKNYYSINKEQIKKQQLLYYEKNKEQINKIRREKHQLNKEKDNEKTREYAKKHRNELAQYAKNYRVKFKDEINNKKNKIYHERMENDSLYKIKILLRSSINNYLKNRGIKKNKKTEEILGCSLEEFKQYIENKFQEGMSWNNKGKWHLDHIIPMASATNEQEAINLCHYSNFQPLWAIDNLKKGAKYENNG